MIKIIENFLDSEVAETLVTGIEETPGGWWSDARAVKGSPVKYYGQDLYSQRMKRGVDAEIASSLTSGFFTYSFTRSTTHAATCECVECKFKEHYLEKEPFLDVMKKEMGLKNPVLFENFISVYKTGDFLSTHTDVGRNVAFILNLSRDWKAEYGGLLHVYTSQGLKAFVPKFNSLILLGLENGKGMNHFVSEVSKYAPRSRIAISGWYNEQDS